MAEFSHEFTIGPRKVDARLPGKGNSHGARPVHLIISMIQWIRPSGFSIKNSLFAICVRGLGVGVEDSGFRAEGLGVRAEG